MINYYLTNKQKNNNRNKDWTKTKTIKQIENLETKKTYTTNSCFVSLVCSPIWRDTLVARASRRSNRAETCPEFERSWGNFAAVELCGHCWVRSFSSLLASANSPRFGTRTSRLWRLTKRQSASLCFRFFFISIFICFYFYLISNERFMRERFVFVFLFLFYLHLYSLTCASFAWYVLSWLLQFAFRSKQT